MALFSKLFGGAKDRGAKAPAATEYEGFRIYAEPAKEGRQFRIGARIELDVDGETKVHHLIRADTLESEDAAKEASVGKAKQMIDQMGARLFDY